MAAVSLKMDCGCEPDCTAPKHNKSSIFGVHFKIENIELGQTFNTWKKKKSVGSESAVVSDVSADSIA